MHGLGKQWIKEEEVNFEQCVHVSIKRLTLKMLPKFTKNFHSFSENIFELMLGNLKGSNTKPNKDIVV